MCLDNEWAENMGVNLSPVILGGAVKELWKLTQAPEITSGP